MPGPVFCEGEAVSLRPIEDEGHAFLREHLNDHRIREWLAIHEPMDAEGIAGWVEDDGIHFLACVDGDPVGHAFYFRRDERSGHAELGYWIAPEEQGQGYGGETVDLLVSYGFEELACTRIVARVIEGNEGSRAILESRGFQQEGLLREHEFAGGEHRDMYYYGLLASER